jgi:hypothetical protein
MAVLFVMACSLAFCADDAITVDSNGNVGVGATPVVAKFEVKASGGGTPNDNIVRIRNTSGVPAVCLDASGGGDSGTFKLFDGSSNEQVRLNANGTNFIKGGNVGIGTTGLGSNSRLAVSGGNIEVYNPNSYYNTHTNGMVLGTYSGYGFIQAPSGSDVHVWNSGTYDLAVFKSNGNVGIGTTQPNAKLEVSGTGGGTIDFRVNGRIATGSTSGYGGMWTDGGSSQFFGYYDAQRMGLYNNGWGLVLQNNGCVGIGTATPTYTLYVNGSFFCNAGWCQSGQWSGSDIKLKENIRYFDRGLDVIRNLKPAQYDYKTADKNQFGFIAQDVADAIPSAVKPGNDGILYLKTDCILSYSVAAIKELAKCADAQREQTQAITAENAALKAQNQKLSDTVDALVKRFEALEAAQKPAQQQ